MKFLFALFLSFIMLTVNGCSDQATAKDTKRGIALEDLSGIHDRVTVRKSQRATLHNWSFYDLRVKIEYKAQRAGVPFSAGRHSPRIVLVRHTRLE